MNNILYKIFVSVFVGAIFLGSYSCTTGFDEMNQNPNTVTEGQIEFFYPAVVSPPLYGGYYTTFGALTASEANWTGWFFNYSGLQNSDPTLFEPDMTYSNHWGWAFGSRQRQMIEMQNIYETLDDYYQEGYTNMMATTKIMKAWTASVTTDCYGDMPYSEAYQGVDNIKPKYDSQKDVYYAILQDLKDAIAEIDPTDTKQIDPENYDQLLYLTFPDYETRMLVWQRIANNIRLRMAMRMSNVDPAKASEVVKEVFATGGPGILENGQTIFRTSEYAKDNQNSGWGQSFWDLMGARSATANPNNAAAAPLVDYLKDTKDPRLMIYFQPATDVTLADRWVGCPTSLKEIQDNYPAAFDASARQSTFCAAREPMFYGRYYLNKISLSYAEGYLLKAEAIVKGYLTGDDVAAYTEGIAGSIYEWASIADIVNNGTDTWRIYYPFSAAEKDTISKMLDISVLTTLVQDSILTTTKGSYTAGEITTKKLERIHTQLWANYFKDATQMWSNLRRTGIPNETTDAVLPPLYDEDGSVRGAIPRRYIYHNDEFTNPDARAAAILRMGGDEYTTRVWWDGGL